MQDLIQRLGYVAYGDNLIVNALENANTGVLTDEPVVIYSEEKDSHSLTLTATKESILASVRMYVEGAGWQMHERIIKP